MSKILNFGSLNLDYVYAVDHMVRPGETEAASKRETFCGGKGLNQSIALARAGAPVYHAGCIGPEGEPLQKALEDSGVDTRFVRRIGTPTGHAVIQVDVSGQNCILLYGGANQEISGELVDETLAYFAPGDMLLLQNEINRLEEIVEKAYRKGMVIALNPSPIGETVRRLDLSKITYILCNEIEGAELTGKEEPQQILDVFRARFPGSRIVLTLGKRGALYDDGETRCETPIYPVKAVDTTAAGDTFTGFFLSGILRGCPPAEAMDTASRASSLAVSRKGASVSIPTLDEVLALKG